jgi:3-(3-hydroxy-phenyl)propionate hydroxylase
LPVTRRTRCRPSARAAPTPACRTSTTWPGSSSWCSTAAPEALLDSYHDERAYAADDNLLNSTRSTDFITPKSRTSRAARRGAGAGRTEPFARPLVNSGRLSTPTPYVHSSSLNTADSEHFAGKMRPGTNCADAPVQVNGQADAGC